MEHDRRKRESDNMNQPQDQVPANNNNLKQKNQFIYRI